MVVTVFILLWIMSIIVIIYKDIENKVNYWYAGIMFSITLGILCEIIRMNTASIETHKEAFELIARFCSALSYRLSPYFAILAGIESYYRGENKMKVYIILFLPVILGFVGDFAYPETGFIRVFPDYSPYFWIIVIWAVPYIIITNVLMILSYIKEESQWLKQQKLLMCILIFPSIFLVFNTFLSPLVFHIHSFKNDLLVYIAFFLIFTISSMKHGIMGVKISLEKMKMDMTMKAISSGTMILIHALKNELNTIAMNSECLDGDNYAVISIRKSTERLLKMTQRINMELKYVDIEKTEGNLNNLIEEILSSLDIYLKNSNIKVIKTLKSQLIVKYDQIYFKEAIINIVKNAIEAMNEDGTLEISAECMGKNILIKIKDTGIGISKENLPHVIAPFFSTKQNIEKNYGLGLTSSYRIIQQHKGILEFISNENKGTTVLIRIPK